MARLAPCLRTTEITQFRRGRTMFLFLGCPRSLSISTPFRGLEKFPAIPGNKYYLSYNSRTTINYSANLRVGVIYHILRGQQFKAKVFRGLISVAFLTSYEDYVHCLIVPRPPFEAIFVREQVINSLGTRGPKKQLLGGPCSLRTKLIPISLRGQVFKAKVFRELSKQLLVVPDYHRSKSNASLTRRLLIQLPLSEDINIGLYYPRTLYSSSMARELSIIPLASRGPPLMSSWTRELT